jgi:hypothetical protein
MPHEEQELHLCVHLSLQNMYICPNTTVRVNTNCSYVSFHWHQKINISSLLDVKHWYFHFTCDIPLCVDNINNWNEYRCQHNCIFTRWYSLSIRRIHSFKYNKQDVTLYNILYYCQCSKCFGRFLRPSSGAQELYTHSSLLAATASSSSKQAWHVPDAVCTVLELLTMGGETARNMWSIDNSKEYCIMLHLVGCT